MSLLVLSTSLIYSNRNSQRLSFQPWGSDVKIVETDVQEQDRATSRAATEPLQLTEESEEPRALVWAPHIRTGDVKQCNVRLQLSESPSETTGPQLGSRGKLVRARLRAKVPAALH